MRARPRPAPSSDAATVTWLIPIADSASPLLPIRARYTSQQQRFLFDSLTLALTAMGEHARAMAVWQQHGKELYPDEDAIPFPMRLLRAQILTHVAE